MDESLPYTLANTGRILISKADPPQPYKIIPYSYSLVNFHPFDVQTDNNGLTYVLNLSGESEIIVFNNEGNLVKNGSLERANRTDIQLGGLAVSDTLVYVSIGSYNQIQVYDKEDIVYITSIGQLGSGPGEFNQPVGLACNNAHLFVCEWGNNRLQVLRNGIFSHFMGHIGEMPGSLRRPKSVAISRKQEIVVLHHGNPGINIYQWEGCLISQIGSHSPYSELDASSNSISIGRNGELVVTYCNRGFVSIIDPKRNYCLKFGGNGYEYGKFNRPRGVCVNNENSIIVCDAGNNRLQCFLLDNILS